MSASKLEPDETSVLAMGCSPQGRSARARSYGMSLMSSEMGHGGFRGVLLALPGSCLARAQSWPDRPIKFINSQAAGGGTVVIGRLVADQLAGKLDQPIVYENRPGGGNVIGTQAAARSAPDGYTFFFASAAALVTDPYTYKSLPYDPAKDFEAVSSIAEVTFMVLAHQSVPA